MLKKILLIGFVIIVGCSKKQVLKINLVKEMFKEIIADSSGVHFSNDLNFNGNLNIIEYLYYYNGGGVALGDINNDGLDDIYFTSNQKQDKIYLNKGNLKFEDISLSSKIPQDSTWSTGVTMVDINEDGFLDIYVCKVGNYKNLKATNRLYINNGDATFTEQAKKYGLDFSGFSTQASFFDYDQDGDMDMYLLNHSIHSKRSYGNIKLRAQADALSGDVLFENKSEKGQMKFVDVTKKAGIYNSALGYGLALAISDVNNDGLIDIYVGNDFHENDYLYINNGDKTYTESGARYFNNTSRFTMGIDIADINNDSKTDIITLDMMPYKAEIFLKSGGEDTDKIDRIKKIFGYQQQYARNHLQLNKGTHFSDIALLTETYATDWSWSPLMLDYDNDGFNDIYITNGIYKRPNDLDYINYISNVDFAKYTLTEQDTLEQKLIETMPTLSLQNVLFKNKGGLEFEKKPINQNNTKTYSNGAAYSDLDLDGDLDIVVNNLNEKATILENKAKGNNFLTINLLGEDGNINTQGAKVYLFVGNKNYYKEQITVRGFLSSSTRKIHFGLGKLKNIDSIEVIWSDNSKTIRKDISINREIMIRKEGASKHIFKEESIIKPEPFEYEHKENSFLDYERETLMPEKLSTEGPSLIQEDFNSDGLVDIFIGGARNQEPVLYMQTKEGEYVVKKSSIFEKDKIYEDVDAIAFDIDADNDLDIYALSGGNDYNEGSPMLEDRVYLNDGDGNFTRLDSKMLATNGGSVSSYDFNRDGFDDLFVGSRSIPSAYGLTPYSYILKNTGNNNFEIVQQKRFGMISGSEWADLDNDGLIELILIGDWMPISVFSYTKDQKFIDQTKSYGLEKTHGMWNVIKIADINKDGFLDIIGGNTGENFKWKASVEKPVIMYLDDFDKNKQLDQIIFYNFFGKDIPFASRDKLVSQLPNLKKKFLRYKTFSELESIIDLVDKDKELILETKFIYELRSMVYYNKNHTFVGNALPVEAQMSTIEDLFIKDNQIFYTGNYDGFVTELGKSTSNTGGILYFYEGKIHQKSNLELPIDFFGRKIVNLRENNYLLVSNNGKSFILKLNTLER